MAVIAAEAALALWLAAGGRGKWRGAGTPEREENSGGGEDMEKRWQEGMSSMMSYDLAAAKRAVRDDDGDE